MTPDVRLTITNLGTLIATTICILGVYRMGGGWICLVGLVPMFGFTFSSGK